MVTSIVGRVSDHNSHCNWIHSTLVIEEHKNGCCLRIDTWLDTNCAGKHAYIEEWVEGKEITATCFVPSLGLRLNLPIEHVLYAYDSEDSTTLLFEANNSIYAIKDMTDYLMQPIQAEYKDVRIDVCPKHYYPNDNKSQTITFSDGTKLPVLYNGVLPYIPIGRPTKEEVYQCRQVQFSSKYDCNPYVLGGVLVNINVKFTERHGDDC